MRRDRENHYIFALNRNRTSISFDLELATTETARLIARIARAARTAKRARRTRTRRWRSAGQRKRRVR